MRKRVMMVVAGTMLAASAAAPVLAQQTDPVVGQGAPVASPKPAPTPAPKLDDTAGTTDANANAAAKADADTRAIVDKQAAYKARVEKQISDYDAKMEEYRRQVRENEAKNAAILRRNEERMALYKSCVAGDKAACATYNSGQ